MIGSGFREFDLATLLPYSFVHSFGKNFLTI